MSLSRLEIAEMARAQLATRHFSDFIRYVMPDYQMGWVHKLIIDKLEAFLRDVLAKKSPRLMICCPPRHGKSELVSRKFPAYALGKYPHLSFIATSYAASLALSMSRDVQRTMTSDAYGRVFPGVSLGRKGTDAVRTAELFGLVGNSGTYRAAGVGSGITGRGADIICVDDVIKDFKEASSVTRRDDIWNWYTSTLYTRLSPGGGIVFINTRWHLDDLSGRLLKAAREGSADRWEVMSFPAIAIEDEEFRKAGEALHPERYPLSLLLSIKETLGSRDWQALYQQSPAPDSGTIFFESGFRYYTKLPDKFDEILLSWDMSFKGADTSDFVCGQAWGRVAGEYYLIEQMHARMGFSDTVSAFVSMAQRYPSRTRKLVEDKANGPAVIDMLKHHVSGIVPIEPRGGKVARAHAVTSLFEAGNVYIPHESLASWVKEYVMELIQFPNAAHDDRVDATTQALCVLSERRIRNINISAVKSMGLGYGL